MSSAGLTWVTDGGVEMKQTRAEREEALLSGCLGLEFQQGSPNPRFIFILTAIRCRNACWYAGHSDHRLWSCRWQCCKRVSLLTDLSSPIKFHPTPLKHLRSTCTNTLQAILLFGGVLLFFLFFCSPLPTIISWRRKVGITCPAVQQHLCRITSASSKAHFSLWTSSDHFSPEHVEMNCSPLNPEKPGEVKCVND